jgi:hypothetical protein
MTGSRGDELERVGELFEGLPDAPPEAREAARAALVARFETSERPSAQRAPRLRWRARLLLAAGCAAALLVATIFVTDSDVATKAYAVQPQPSGLVIVFVNSLEDGEGLQRALREAGVPAVVEFNDRSDQPPLRGQPGPPPQFRSVLPSAGSVGACIAKLPGSGVTVELPYPESLAHLADLDPSLRPTLQRSTKGLALDTLRELKRTLSPAGFRRVLRLEKKRKRLASKGTQSHPASVPTVPPFTFVPTEDLVPPTEEKGVTFIIDPSGLEADERLHVVTAGDELKSMTVYSRNAICTASGRNRSEERPARARG